MRKYILFFVVSQFLFFLSSCMVVDDDSFIINVCNYSNIDVFDINVGKVYIGTVFKGQSTKYKFFEEEKKAIIAINGFSPSLSFIEGKIDLKKGYIYELDLKYDNVQKKYIYSMQGIYYNDNGKVIFMN